MSKSSIVRAVELLPEAQIRAEMDQWLAKNSTGPNLAWEISELLRTFYYFVLALVICSGIVEGLVLGHPGTIFLSTLAVLLLGLLIYWILCFFKDEGKAQWVEAWPEDAELFGPGRGLFRIPAECDSVPYTLWVLEKTAACGCTCIVTRIVLFELPNQSSSDPVILGCFI